MNGAASLLLEWLVTYALHGTLLLAAAWALTRLALRRAPRAAEIVWRAALFGGLVTASLHVFAGAPLWRAPLVERAAAVETPAAPQPAETPASLPAWDPTAVTFETGPVAPVVAPAAGEETGSGAPSPAWLLLLWPLGTLALLARGRRTRLGLVSVLGGRRACASPPLRALLDGIGREAGLARTVRLTTSPRLTSPVAIGWRRPEVCLPERAVEGLAPPHLEAMLAHETAHLARRDPLWLAAYRALAALLFFQPLNHLAVARLRDLSEVLCDAWAARSRRRRVALAECLTIVADWILAGPAPAAAPAMARRVSRLGERVRLLLDGAPVRGRARLGLLALVPLALVFVLAPGLGAVAARVVPVAATAAARDAPVETAGEAGALVGLDRELALLTTEVEELGRLLAAADRPDLAARIGARLASLRQRRDALREALAREGR